MQYRSIKIILCLAVMLIVSAPSVAKTTTGEISAFVSILPQAYFVERIGGKYVDVTVLVGPGQSPATYEPTPKQMARLGRSQLYFRIGTPFERGFIDKISRTFTNLTIIDTRKGVTLRYFKQSQGLEVPDPHIWLDPKRVKIQAETISKALKETDPAHADEFEKNLKAFQADLDRVDMKIAGILAPLKGGKIYVFHPAFGYFAESYGLTQVAVEIEGKEPSPKQLSRLINMAKKEEVRVIFVQPQYATKEARTVARAIGGVVVPINPLPWDYLKNLEDMANIIEKGLRRQQ
jgi:zinc transport system substrate-binding protein